MSLDLFKTLAPILVDRRKRVEAEQIITANIQNYIVNVRLRLTDNLIVVQSSVHGYPSHR